MTRPPRCSTRLCEVLPRLVPRVTEWKNWRYQMPEIVWRRRHSCRRSKKLLTQHVGADRQEDKKLVPFDLDAWEASFVEVGRILPDPAEMLKRCASLIDKALGAMSSNRCCQSKEVATQWVKVRRLCVFLFLQFWCNVQGLLDFIEQINDLLAEKKHFEELGGDLDARLVDAEVEARVRAYRASLQAARGTMETVSELPVFLRAYFVDWVKFKADAVESWLAYIGGDKMHTRLC